MQKFILIALVLLIGAASTSKNFEDTKSNEKGIDKCKDLTDFFWRYFKKYSEEEGGISFATSICEAGEKYPILCHKISANLITLTKYSCENQTSTTRNYDDENNLFDCSQIPQITIHYWKYFYDAFESGVDSCNVVKEVALLCNEKKSYDDHDLKYLNLCYDILSDPDHRLMDY